MLLWLALRVPERRTLQWLTATNAASTSSRPYFIKMPTERHVYTGSCLGRSGRVISNLGNPSCLIIDRSDHCVFDKKIRGCSLTLVDRRTTRRPVHNDFYPASSSRLMEAELQRRRFLLCALDRILRSPDFSPFAATVTAERNVNLFSDNLRGKQPTPSSGSKIKLCFKRLSFWSFLLDIIFGFSWWTICGLIQATLNTARAAT